MLGLALALSNQRRAAGGGVTPPAFAPGAIHFDTNSSSFGTASALTASGTAVTGGSTGAIADTALLTVSYWIRGVTVNASLAHRPLTSSFTDMISSFSTTANSELTPGINSVIDNNGSASSLRTNLSNATPAAANYNAITNFTTDEWRHVLYSMDGTPNSTSKYFSLYIDGVKQGTGGILAPSTSPFLAAVSNSQGWNAYWQYASSGQFDLAEVFCDFTTSIVDSSNNISAANIAKFISGGKPVDLGTKGNVPLGRTPEIYLSARSGVSGIVNRGTVTGLTAANIYDAGYGPAGPPVGRPYIKTAYGEKITAAAITVTTVNFANNVKAGDLILQFWHQSENADGINHSPSTSTSGYTLLDSITSTGVGASGTAQSALAVWKYAATDGESTAMTWNWSGTTGAGSGGSQAQWLTMVISGVNQTNPFDGHAVAGDVGASTTYVAPTITTTQANVPRLSVFFTWFPNTITVPAGSTRVVSGGRSQFATLPAFNVNYDVIVSPGATAGQTVTSGVATSADLFSIGLKA